MSATINSTNSTQSAFGRSQLKDEADGPDDLEHRLEAVKQQIKWLHQLNTQFGTNFTNLSRVLSHCKRAGLIETMEYNRLAQINQRANEAKHHDLGCTTLDEDRSNGRDETLDSADLGIIAVLKASSQLRELAVREIYLLGLARDPKKEQMGAGVKKEMNRRLYKLQRKGHVVTQTPGRWCFKSEISESAVCKSGNMTPTSDSVLPSSFGTS